MPSSNSEMIRGAGSHLGILGEKSHREQVYLGSVESHVHFTSCQLVMIGGMSWNAKVPMEVNVGWAALQRQADNADVATRRAVQRACTTCLEPM